ncbi:hypothetical protein ACJIZ3_015029 [Penstemon smallii]|uniref:peroxidase n=1 Tax=Penstemon smallii TaxID=265156 RepID=A0ABD3RSX5_9LAMI
MTSAIKKDPRTAAAVLRLVFHDCQVGGCDGSVLLDIKDKTHQAELDSSKNFGIRNRELVDQIKSKVEAVCPKQVSCADVLVLAGRDGVAIAGGPNINVPLGRKDTKIPHTKQQADVGLPRNNVDLAKAVDFFFEEAGSTYEETIAILGAHTLGVTHCDGIMDRLYVNRTVSNPKRKVCPKDNSTRFTTQFDLDPTPQTFDNKYFVNILNGHGVISLDAEIARDPKSIGYVKKFANDKEAFFRVFSSGYVKLSTIGGCDGSVLLNIKDKNHQAEFDSPKNFGIRNRELIDKIKSKAEAVCPKQVSCADILVLAARDGVAIAGGPHIKVPLGRKDTKIPHTKQQADVGLPRNNVDLAKAVQVFFKEAGITYEETIAILGAHTLGVTHCDGIMDRLYVNKAVSNPKSEVEFVDYLKKKCPKDNSTRFTTQFDLDPTPQTFDNKYFANILKGHGVIALDAEIARDPRSIGRSRDHKGAM